MDTNAENAVARLLKSDPESSAVANPDSTGLSKEAEDDFFVGNGNEGTREYVSPALQMMVNELGRVNIALALYLIENKARLKIFEHLRDAVDASIQKVTKRGETLMEMSLDVDKVLFTFKNTKELPENMEDVVLEAIESFAKLREKSPKVDESLFLIAEVHQVVAERKNTRVYIKRFCDYLRGTVVESNSQSQINGDGEVHPIDSVPNGDDYDSAEDQNDEDSDPDDYDDSYYDESFVSNSTIHTNGNNFGRVVSEAKTFTRAQYENCAVVFCKVGHPFRCLSSKSSNNSAIARELGSPGENDALWFLDSMWYSSSMSAATDLERLEKVSGKTYNLKEIFGHLTEQCLAYVDLSILERIGTVYKGAEDKKFLDFVTKFVMRNYFVPRSLRQLHLAIPPQTPLAQLDPLHPGLYRGLELHLHFPRLSKAEGEDEKWMMAVCRKLVHKFPCELRDVRGFYFKECKLSEEQVKDFMKFLDGEFPKTKIVCIDSDHRTDEVRYRQQRLYSAMGFTLYDKAEDGLLHSSS